MREVLQLHKGPRGTQVRVIEKPGGKITQDLARNNPFPRENCSRPDCPLAASGAKCREQCHGEGVVYAAECNRCNQPGDRKYVYIGESSRTIYVRTSQHRRDYRRAERQGLEAGNECSSWMWDHKLEAHSNDLNIDPVKDFTFSILNRHRDPMTRQLEEAVRVTRALDNNKHTDKKNLEIDVISLNRRGETFEPNRRWDPDQYSRFY